MKLYGIIECPFCGNKNTHVYQYTNVELWDDSWNKILNEQYPDSDELHCDTITYKCKCDNCDSSFISKLKLKCEIESIITVKKESDFNNNYFKK